MHRRRVTLWAVLVVVFLGPPLPSVSQTHPRDSRFDDFSSHRDTVSTYRDAKGALALNTRDVPSESDEPGPSREMTWRDDTPLITADGRMMFFNSTRRGTRPWARLVPDSSRYDDDIYYRMRITADDGMEAWGDPVNLGPGVNTSADDGVAAISANGTRVYLSSLRPRWEEKGGPFFTAEIIGRRLRKFAGLGGGITEFFLNRDRGLDFKIYGAAIDVYERTFFFATNANSRDGRLQLWMSRKHGDSWSYPVNLGPKINDAGGAYAPYFAADGRTLYFSSRRPGGYGGDDLFRTTIDSSGVASDPINLGPEINSDDNEAFLCIPAAGDWVYFARGTKSNVGLSSTPLPLTMRPGGVAVLSGFVRDRASGQPIAAMVTIEDLNADTIVFAGPTSDIDNRYSAVLRPGANYGISVSALGYVFSSANYDIPDATDFLRLERDFELDRVISNTSFTLHNIFFDYDRAELKSESTMELERLVTMMQKSSRLRIEIGGHTDNIGSDGYNLDLSERRARAVRQYLLDNGVEPIRVMIRGYGSASPIAPNDTEVGRSENRRVAFTIISM